MKRCILVVALISLMAVSANAGLYIAWQAAYGFHLNGNEAQGLLGPASSGLSTIVQLIFSTDVTADIVDPNNAAGHYVSGNDTWLAEITITEGVGGIDEWAYFSAQSYEGAYSAGYFFGRIFQDTTPALGEYYYNGSVTLAEDRTVPPAAPQLCELNTIFTGAGNNVNIEIIPEPGTLALFGIGLLTIAAGRARRRQ